MKKILLTLISFTLLFSEDNLEIEAEINRDMSSTYFAYIDFDFENNTQDWQILEEVQISFGSDKDQFVEVLSGQKYNEWLKATTARNKEREANRQIALAIIGGIGGAMIGSNNNAQLGQSLVVGSAAFETLSAFNKNVSDKKRAETLPDNYIYKGSLILPPGLAVKRFVVLNSKDHKKLGYITSLKLSYKLENQEKSIDLTFRGGQYSKQGAGASVIAGGNGKKKSGYVWEDDL